ncbi:MAG: ankyrin repeat domain-containing protein [Nitrospira sp.]|nr:ankyrin repeat domain-containing protein [Nitrospira sp.]
MFRLHHSTGVTCALLLLMFGLPSVSHARPDKPQPKPNASLIHSERSIHRALTDGTAAQAIRLLDQGANIEARDAQGATPLITAAGRGNLALVTLFLSRHAEVEATDRAGNTALHQASFYGQGACVEALLATGAQTSARNALAFTPLHQAVRRFWELSGESRAERLTRQADVIDALLRHGADPDLREAGGRTPITLATESSNGSLRHAFNRAPVRAIPAAEIPTRPQSPAATADSSEADPGIVASDPETGSHTVQSAPPAPARSAAPLPAVPSPKPSTDMAAQDDRQPGLSVIPIPSTAVTESSSGPIVAKSLPPAPEGASAATSPADTTLRPHTSPIPATPIETAPTRDHEATPAIASQPLVAESQPPADRVTPFPPQVSGMPPAKSFTPLEPVPLQTTPQPAPTPLIAAIDTQVETKPAASPPTNPQHRSIATIIESAEDIRKPRQPHQLTPSIDSAHLRSAPLVASADSSPATASAPLVGATGPSTDHPPPSPPASTTDKKEDPPDRESERPWMLQRLGFGLGLGWTHNLGPRRVDSVTVVNRIVRIDNERNDLVRVMPEMHFWIDRWDEQRWSWGPFLTVAPGSRIIDAVGFGLMMGYRPHRQDQYSFNVGIGGTLDLDARVLGDGLIANEPLPPRETTARTKQTTAAGLLLLFSVGWDLAAPHHPAQTERP